MRLLPIIAIAGCLNRDYDIPEEEQDRCAPQIQALEQSCAAWDGSFQKAVDSARLCLTEQVRIVCQNPGYGETKTIKIERRR